MNIKEIKELLQLMAEHGLQEVELEKDGLKIKLKKGGSIRAVTDEIRDIPQTGFAPVVDITQNAGTQAPRTTQEAADIVIVRSPMVGTYYAAPAPDQPLYASVGKKIQEGDVLCIIEAMKLMNEIKSEMSGILVEILVKNGQPVEFDQPLFKIKKD